MKSTHSFFIDINLFPMRTGTSECTVGQNCLKSTRRSLGHSLFRLLIPLTHLLSPFCSLHSRALLRSFVRLLARPLTRSRSHGKEVFFYEMNASISYSFNSQCTGFTHRPMRSGGFEHPIPLGGIILHRSFRVEEQFTHRGRNGEAIVR